MHEKSPSRPRLVSRREVLRGGAMTGLAAAGLVGLGRTASAGAAVSSPSPPRPSVLPNWAIGPFTRYRGNPILTPQGDGFESRQVFNPGVVARDGTFHMLYRGTRSGNYSEIGAAASHDGHRFIRFAGNPAIPNTLPNEAHGVEDPRLFYRDGTYYAFFTGYSGTSIDINEAVSADAVHWHQLGPVLHDNKNGAVVADPRGRPVKIDGRYMMYYGQSGSGTYLASSTDMRHWTTVGPVDLHFPPSYAPYELCVAVTNYPTVYGRGPNRDILLFVAGTLMSRGRWFYAVSEVAYSAADLTRQIGQLDHAVLAPTAPYEINGVTARTVFMNSIIFDRGRWWMYYGAADTVIALATARLRTPARSG